jgi:hypothetical protein
MQYFSDITRTITNIYWVRELSKIKQILTWSILPSGVWRSVVWYRRTNVFEECAASIYRVESVEYFVLSFGTYLPKSNASRSRREYSL